MTLHFFKIPSFNRTIFYIPLRFQKSKGYERNYITLMFLFQNVFKTYDMIMQFINKLEKPAESEVSLKIRVMNFKELVMTYRHKYVVSTWRPEDSERLHNEMTVDVSNLLFESNQIGHLWRQIKSSRK